MIMTLSQKTHTLTPAAGGGYFVINSSTGYSIGRVQRNRTGVWTSQVRSPWSVSGWEATAEPVHCTRAAAATECMRAHFGMPLPI